MTETTAVRVLPPDVFDALELSAEAFEGIGAFTYTDDGETPCCVLGHAHMLDRGLTHFGPGPVRNALEKAFGSGPEVAGWNNRAVCSVSKRAEGRITFADWCLFTGVVRGAT